MTIDIILSNWLGVLLSFVAYFMLGALWFTALFKKQYMFSLGKENTQQSPPSAIFIAGPAACTLVITITSAILMNALNIRTYDEATLFALVVGVGYLFANTINIAINPNMPRPILYGIISGVYHVVGLIICCLIQIAFL